MPILLDTSALELMRRRHREVESLVLRHFPPLICVHVAGEFLFGRYHASAPRLPDPRTAEFLDSFEMLISDRRTAVAYARIRSDLAARGITISDPDYWIAAHALEGRLPLLTTDGDFIRIPELRVHRIRH